VTLFARRREARMRYRRGGVVVVLLVARNARRHGDVVVVIGMTLSARRGQVLARQRPARRRVIKLAIRPQHGVVALFAGGREARVIHRRLRVVVILLMAGNASDHRNVVVVVDVTGDARRSDVRARQREGRLGMIKGRWLPSGRGMANLTGLRKTQCHVVGTLGPLEVRQVAGNASRHRDLVVVVDMAVGARG